MLKPFSSLRSALPVAVAALSFTVGVSQSFAQSGVTLQAPAPIGQPHASVTPYNFTGRVFNVAESLGSGTLLRRQTVLTAGHVVYAPTTGFVASTTFERGLYENFVVSRTPVTGVQVLAGFQQARTADAALGISDEEESLPSFALDQGLLLLHDAPVDENWGNFTYNPAYLSTYPTFILGYPGVTFDGRTMAYIVPSAGYVAVPPGLYENDDYTAEPGMSGGPIYVAFGKGQQYVAGTLSGGFDDGSGEFNSQFIRQLDNTSRKFIDSAEFTSGLIKKIRVTGAKTVARGTTVRFTAVPVFTTPSVSGHTKVNTDRYDNITLQSSTPLIPNSPSVHIKKVSNGYFDVTFDAGLPSNSTTTIQAYYSKGMPASGQSSLVVTIK